jgi:hypothetical protein
MSEKEVRERTAQEIFDLLGRSNLKTEQGYIEISLAGILVRVKDKSSVGNLFQEWFKHWLYAEKTLFKPNKYTQKFPDFYLQTQSEKEGLLEIKLFDASASPQFDIANFDAYVRSVRTHGYRLNADYLIFGYTLEDGVLRIKDFWLKKIWEISGTSSTRPIRVQEKQGKIVNLRPIIWFSEVPSVTPPFTSRQEFLIAIRDTLAQRDGINYAEDWFREVSQSYAAYYQTSIDSP